MSWATRYFFFLLFFFTYSLSTKYLFSCFFFFFSFLAFFFYYTNDYLQAAKNMNGNNKGSREERGAWDVFAMCLEPQVCYIYISSFFFNTILFDKLRPWMDMTGAAYTKWTQPPPQPTPLPPIQCDQRTIKWPPSSPQHAQATAIAGGGVLTPCCQYPKWPPPLPNMSRPPWCIKMQQQQQQGGR